MGEVSYLPLIEQMVWSYSRLSAFRDCPYKFFLRHISRVKDEDRFYASYGSFIHKLIEKYYNGELPKEKLQTEFLVGFSNEVKGKRPKKELVQKYIQKGAEYFKSFEPFPYKPIGIEKKVEFKLGDYDFIGYIDYLGEDEDGELVVIDNKSRGLKPRSKRATPTKNDQLIDSMLKQLYLYSGAVKQEYGKFPKKLCFNCFKAGTFIEEPFSVEAYEAAVKWALETIEEIKEEEEFLPNPEYFGCTNICGVSGECIYYEEMRKEMRRKWKK